MVRRTSGRLRTASLLAALGGLVLFAWAMQQAGTTAVVDGVKRVGSGIIVIIALGGVRALARTVAWRLCLDPDDRPALGSMLAVFLAGDAIGNVTPFGFFISEPLKIVLVRGRIPVQAAVASLALENLFYTATIVVMLVAGAAALLLSFPLPRPLEIVSMIVLIATPLLTAMVAWLVTTRRRFVGGAVEWLARHRLAARYLSKRLPEIRQTGARIVGFAERRPGAVAPLILLEASYHAAAVAEIWFALGLITGVQPPLLTAIVLEAVNRTITTAFQFVPMWLGVDEAGTSMVTSAVHLGSAAGVSLALVRKARVVTWTAIGFLLLLTRGVSVRGAAREADVLAAAK
jgi:hypothetical protein